LTGFSGKANGLGTIVNNISEKYREMNRKAFEGGKKAIKKM
jgi:hypothetical protein